ncbi:MAG: HD domain-containing phosphohydrolase [Dehalococcoidia bacterium]
MPYAILALALAMFGAFFVTRMVVGTLSERFTNQLVEASRVAADTLVRQERDHLLTLRSISFTEGLPEAVAERRTSEVSSVALSIAVNQSAERVEVLDRAGNRLFGVRLDDQTYVPIEDDPPAQWDIVQRVLNGGTDPTGDKFAGLLRTSTGAVLYSVGPVRLPSGEIVGAVLVGSSMDRFVRRAKTEALADVTVYGSNLADGATVMLATSFAGDRSPLEVTEAPTAGERQSLVVSDRDFDAIFNELRVRGITWGWYSVALPRSFIATTANMARDQLAVFFTLATLGVLVIGWLLARSLTRPLARLVRAADAVSGGDFTIRSGVSTSDEIGDLATAFDSMAGRLERSHFNTLSALVSAIDARDAYTRGHSVRVGHLAADLGRAMSLSSIEMQHLQVGGMLHDIGKIGIRDAVLLKPGGLSDEERETIQAHPRIGLRILESVDLPTEVQSGVGGHHERLDGSGYPNGLSGDAVSLYPRIISVADVYDALITDRPYRAALPLAQVLRMLDEEAERGLLDPDVVRTLHQIALQWEHRRKNDQTLEGFTLSLNPLVAMDRLNRLMGAS